MARDTCRAVQVGLHNLTDAPLRLDVRPGPLIGEAGSFPAAVTWPQAFIPYGADRQAWTPFFLMRRPDVTVPPLNVAGLWLTVDTHGVPPGQYTADVKVNGHGVPEHTITLRVRVAPLQVGRGSLCWSTVGRSRMRGRRICAILLSTARTSGRVR